ncbi:VOC family protein [Mucilaginibacter limnophilus]|uniref:VOC family protein n=1 Tax=Mucilaginibacter limnophilus TaxID=1932778 RepID=A0A437MUS3_9SPHI|nr:VOC family protein [Mucilaginibacter limnophilus]RVU01405.1 VOC family protein [Mucilaginibacter limnophilus]
MVINPYFNFNGNTEEAFNFYKSVFGGEFIMVMRFSDSPEAGNVPPGTENMIMHIALPVGNNILMGTDAPDTMGFKLNMGNNIYMTLSPDSREQTDELFAKLSEGGSVDQPLQDMFWGAYFGTCTDKFGVLWMFSYDPKFANQ